MKKVFLACALLSVMLLLAGCTVDTNPDRIPPTSVPTVAEEEEPKPAESASEKPAQAPESKENEPESASTESKAEKKKTPTVADQLSLIGKNLSLWNGESYIESYYAVADLNQNGRIEILTADCQGSGLFTSCGIYEVNEKYDGLTKLDPNLSEGDFWPDIIVDSADVFLDKSNNTYHYIIDDIVRISAAENMTVKNSVDVCGGKVKITKLAVAHSTADENMEMVTKFYLPNNPDSEITAGEFDKIEDKTYSKCEKHHVKFGWKTVEPGKLEKYSNAELLDMLEQTYSEFKFE